MERKSSKWLYWTPRILSIAFILFLMLFSLDVFEAGASAWNIIIGLLIHNIPAFILIAVLIIAWRHEIVGAIAFILAGLLYIILILISILRNSPHTWYMLFWTLTISGPAFLIGGMFFALWKDKRNKRITKR